MIEKILKFTATEAFRVYVLKIICVVFLMFLSHRLYLVQIVYSHHYATYLNQAQTLSLQKNVSRGFIYDRNMETLVANEAINTVIYQYYPGTALTEMQEVANRLADLIPEDAATIFSRMNQGGTLTPNIIKTKATNEEIARISEQLNLLPGIDVEVDWNRIYPSKIGYSQIFGSVSSYEQGLPEELKNEYRAYGYEWNNRVGLSQLEHCYEPFLRGYKSKYQIHFQGEELAQTQTYEGQHGLHLSLTLDVELQKKVDEIVENRLLKAKMKNPSAKYLREGYVVILNPNTGEVLSMNGKIIEYNFETKQYEVINHPLGTFQSAFTMGSVIKGATLLAGFDQGITRIGDVCQDQPLIFADGSKKASWTNLGYINEVEALKYSSNIYFMLQTIQMAGGNYQERKDLNLDLDVFNTYRRFFSKFGIGVSTGIDLSHESIGLRDREITIAKLLDLVIGQADTYTAMQMAQYVGTVATKGERFRTQIVKDVYLPFNNQEEKVVIKQFEPQLLDKINLDRSYFERVEEGFKRALQETEGTGNKVFAGVGYNPAGKTGTAEEFVRDQEGKLMKDQDNNFIPVHNTTFVGYAPAHQPEIAIAVVLPQAELPDTLNYSAQEIARDAMQAYFDLRAKSSRAELKR